MNTNDHVRLQTKRTIASAGKRKCTRASGDETTRRRARRGAGNESDACRYVHHHLFLIHHLPLSAQIRPRQPAHRERGHHSRHVTPPPSHRLAQPHVHHLLFLLLHLPLSTQIRLRQPPRRERSHHSRRVAPPSHRLAQPHIHHHLFLLLHLPLSAQIRPRQPPHRERAHHSRHVTPPPSHRLAQPQIQPNGRLAASARVEEGEGLRETGEERGWVGCRVSQNSPPPSHHLEKCMAHVN
jgi:hypothetical protein